MRRGLALLALLALAAQPAWAQGKTKGPVQPASVEALEVCEIFARGDVLAVEAAGAAGWEAYEDESESPYVRSYSAAMELPGIGYADLFALVESYPDQTLGYCRIDVAGPVGNGHAAIQAIQDLERYEGQSQLVSEGTFASLIGRGGPQTLLLTHWTTDSFVIQLTIITPRAGATGQ
jgi:hypothetical protein